MKDKKSLFPNREELMKQEIESFRETAELLEAIAEEKEKKNAEKKERHKKRKKKTAKKNRA